MQDKNEITNRIISVIDKLPPIPDNIVKLRKKAADPNVNFCDIVPILKDDPGLCADILHIANSAFYSVQHKVETVDEAVRYFGVEHLIDFLALSFSEKVIKNFFSKINDLNDYFKHSRDISMATTMLCKTAKKSPHEQNIAGVAGLLHDIGRLIIILVSDEKTQKLVSPSWDCIKDIVKNEREVLGIDHCQVGMKICKKWDFPKHLQEVVLRHHNPIDEPLCEEGAFVLLAHFIAMRDFSENMLINVFPPEVKKKLGLTDAIISQVREDFNAVL